MPRILGEREIEAFREKICRVATRRFAESGMDGVTLRGLAQELGCSPMTPYRYYKDKEEIFDAVRVDALRRFNDQMLEAAGRHADPVDRLRATGRQYLEFAKKDPHAYRIIFQLDQAGAGPHDDSELRRGWEPLVATMRAGIETGRFHGDPNDLAHVAWCSLHGLVTLQLAGKLRLGRSIENLLDPMLECVIRGASVNPREINS